jgi:mannonate dehydratase
MLLTDYFRYPKDATWDIARQCGVEHGVIRLPETKEFDLTNKGHWQQVYQGFKDYGITPVIVEPMPNEVHDHIKAGDELRDASIERVLKILPIMDELDVRCICFNWMAHIGWLRTRSDIIERGGAKVTEFNIADFKPTGAKITAEELWANYEYFLKAVVPVAEKHNIKLALHPDDPPRPNLGDVGRIMISRANIEKAIYDIVPSEMLGVTFCQATFRAMGEDVFALLEEFGEKVFFFHFRDITGVRDNFRETFHDNGPTDMPRLLAHLKKCAPDCLIRPDHTPTMAGESNESFGYTMQGNLFATGYLRGMLEALDVK